MKKKEIAELFMVKGNIQVSYNNRVRKELTIYSTKKDCEDIQAKLEMGSVNSKKTSFWEFTYWRIMGTTDIMTFADVIGPYVEEGKQKRILTMLRLICRLSCGRGEKPTDDKRQKIEHLIKQIRMEKGLFDE